MKKQFPKNKRQITNKFKNSNAPEDASAFGVISIFKIYPFNKCYNRLWAFEIWALEIEFYPPEVGQV